MIKQVIVMRKDLNMRKGKMCAQAAHASMKTSFATMHHFEFCNGGDIDKERFGFQRVPWYKAPFLKIALGLFSWVTGIPVNDRFVYKLYDSKNSYIGQWLSDIFTKVVVGVDTAEELQKIKKDVYVYNQSLGLVPGDDMYIPCESIIDSGATEFHGFPTLTCIAVGPAPSELIDKFTGQLKLL